MSIRKHYVRVRPAIAFDGYGVPIAVRSLEHDPYVHYYYPKTDNNRPKESRYIGDDLQVFFGKRWRFVCGTDWDFLTDEEGHQAMVEPGLNEAGKHFMGYR